MKGRKTFNLILFTFIILASAILLMDDHKTDTAITQKQVSNLSADSINVIRVERKELTNMEFQREKDQWMMTKPYRIRAANHRVLGILDLLNSKSQHQLDANTVDLGQLDLAEPSIRLNLNDGWFDFGGINPLDEQRYLLHANTVHLIHDTLFPQLSTNPVFFIDTQVFTNTSGIQTIQFPDGILKQDISGNWVYSGDENMVSEVLKERIAAWQTLKASTVQKSMGLSPMSSITIKFMDGEKQVIDVVSEQPNLALQRPGSPIQYQINEFTAASLFPPRQEAEKSAELQPE